MIPKKIHYIWLGKKPKSKVATICLNSWFNVLKSYEIIERNEDNIDLVSLRKQYKFLDECLKRKLWAFASDFLRLYILYQYGGIYLDTDVQVLKGFDSYLDKDSFFGLEENNYIGTGIIGAVKGSRVIGRLLQFYYCEIFKSNIYNNPIIFKKIYDEEPEVFSNTLICNTEVFSPVSLFNGMYPKNTLNTITIHWYTKDWNLSLSGECYLRTKHMKNPFLRLLVKVKIFLKRLFKVNTV